MPAKMISLGSTSDALFKPHLTTIDVLCVFLMRKFSGVPAREPLFSQYQGCTSFFQRGIEIFGQHYLSPQIGVYEPVNLSPPTTLGVHNREQRAVAPMSLHEVLPAVHLQYSLFIKWKLFISQGQHVFYKNAFSI